MTGQIPEVELDQSQRPGRQQPTGRLARQAGNVDEERWHPEGTIHSASYKVEELPSPPLLFRLNWARCLEAAIPSVSQADRIPVNMEHSIEMQATSAYSSSQFSTGKPGILWKC
jgi:hypothetical protein